MNGGNTDKNRRLGWVALVLLILYVSCSLHADFLHHLVHSHEQHVLHAAKHEEDPCHRSIYHHKKNNSCEHKAHLTKAEKCSLCQFSVDRNQWLGADQQVNTFFYDGVPQSIALAFPVTEFSIHRSSRAPPVY